jgi:hypothetical protein
MAAAIKMELRRAEGLAGMSHRSLAGWKLITAACRDQISSSAMTPQPVTAGQV